MAEDVRNPIDVQISKSERLLAYAAIFEAPRYDPVSGTKSPVGDANLAAAEALRFYAANLERDNREKDK